MPETHCVPVPVCAEAHRANVELAIVSELAQCHPHVFEVSVVVAVRLRLVHFEERAHGQRIVAHVVVLYDALPLL